jgi:hypothetical protein
MGRSKRTYNLFVQVVEGLYDCKSEVIGPGEYRFKAEIGASHLLAISFFFHDFKLECYTLHCDLRLFKF